MSVFNCNEWPKELKNLAIKFNIMLDRIQASFNQLSEFSSDISHELRNPINNLRGITEIALTKVTFPEECQQMLETCMDEYYHLSKLIENLLFLARSDHGQLILKKQIINAKDEILKLYDYYQAMADEKNIMLTCSGDATIFVDQILFERVISNLLSNSLRYTQPNGTINITIAPKDNNILISIQDTGVGIAAEHLVKIFDRFYRVDSSRTSQSGGLGLGLAIVKSIVVLHKGQITLTSQLNSGTMVRVALPNI